MLKYLIEKEFKQIVRNSFLPRLIIVMPLMIMLVLPWAADQEIKNVKLSVIDTENCLFGLFRSGRCLRYKRAGDATYRVG